MGLAPYAKRVSGGYEWRAVAEMADGELREESRWTLGRAAWHSRHHCGSRCFQEWTEVLGRGFEVDAEVRRRAASVSTPVPAERSE